MSDDVVVARAHEVLDNLGNDSGLYELERYREWLQAGGPRDLLAEVDRLRRALRDMETRLPLEVCQSCGGRGTWEVECCNGSTGCPCRGGLVEMGRCHACGGMGQVEPGKWNGMANANFILNNHIGYPGGGPR